jgi:hypothetical protein
MYSGETESRKERERNKKGKCKERKMEGKKGHYYVS